jgi:hypothetical protein
MANAQCSMDRQRLNSPCRLLVAELSFVIALDIFLALSATVAAAWLWFL